MSCRMLHDFMMAAKLSLPKPFIGDWTMQDDVECPKCNSPSVRVLSATHPRAYECMDCGHSFVSGKHALLDE